MSAKNALRSTPSSAVVQGSDIATLPKVSQRQKRTLLVHSLATYARSGRVTHDWIDASVCLHSEAICSRLDFGT